MLSTLFFYLFAFTFIASAFMVISSRNPVHSVLFLILTFVNAAGLFMLAGWVCGGGRVLFGSGRGARWIGFWDRRLIQRQALCGR